MPLFHRAAFFLQGFMLLVRGERRPQSTLESRDRWQGREEAAVGVAAGGEGRSGSPPHTTAPKTRNAVVQPVRPVPSPSTRTGFDGTRMARLRSPRKERTGEPGWRPNPVRGGLPRCRETDFQPEGPRHATAGRARKPAIPGERRPPSGLSSFRPRLLRRSLPRTGAGSR